jgi:hypothetical protein
VLLLTDSLVRGGAQRQLVGLALNPDRGHLDPTIMSYFDLQQFKAEFDVARILFVLVETKSALDVGSLIRLTRFLVTHRETVAGALGNADPEKLTHMGEAGLAIARSLRSRRWFIRTRPSTAPLPCWGTTETCHRHLAIRACVRSVRKDIDRLLKFLLTPEVVTWSALSICVV